MSGWKDGEPKTGRVLLKIAEYLEQSGQNKIECRYSAGSTVEEYTKSSADGWTDAGCSRKSNIANKNAEPQGNGLWVGICSDIAIDKGQDGAAEIAEHHLATSKWQVQVGRVEEADSVYADQINSKIQCHQFISQSFLSQSCTFTLQWCVGWCQKDQQHWFFIFYRHQEEITQRYG